MTKAAGAKRELYLRRITEIHAIAEAAQKDAQQKTAFLVRYADVAEIAEDFQLAHLKMIQDANADFEVEDAHRARFDMMYYSIKAIYHALEPTHPPTVSVSTSSKVKLPKIPLPHFSGDLASWPSFIALYNTSIHENAQLSSIEKYQYLTASLTGDALNVVKNLPLSPEHYAIAYDLLVSRYQNKRKLATHYWHSLVDAKPLKMDSAEALRRLLDVFNENIRALKLMRFPTESWDFILLNTLLDKLTPSLREKFESEHRKEEIPKYQQLEDFLLEYVQVFTSMSGGEATTGRAAGRGAKSTDPKPSSAVSSFVTKAVSCAVCKDSHAIAKCPDFLKLSADRRHSKARELKLCLNCLRAGHRLADCPSHWTCRACNAKHHSLLHFDRSPSSSETSVSVVSDASGAASVVPGAANSSVALTSIARSAPIILLSTVRAEILDVHRNPLPVRVLLDCASQSNFITESCAQRGGFSRTYNRGVVLAVGDSKAATTRGGTSFVLRVRDRDDVHIPIAATILSSISSQLPNCDFETKSWGHLEGLTLADPEYHVPGSIDILLGAEIFVSLLREGHRKGRGGRTRRL